MKIAEVSIARPVLASMLTLSLVVFGMASYRRMGINLFPDVDFPVVTVTVPFEGADPETVETEVTDRIEEAVNTISGIKTLRSESSEGLAQVFIEFNLEEDIDVVSQDVRDKVAAIRGDLPREIDAPIIEKFDPDSSPILAIVLSGTASIGDLTRVADDVVKTRIEGVSGVGNVRLVGDREREIRIWLRQDQLQSRQLTAQDVIDRLVQENLEPPGGRVETDTRELIVKTKGKLESVEEFSRLPVATRGRTLIRLGDVAWVEDGLEEYRSLARLDGQRAVSLLVRQQSGSNTLAVAGAVKAALEDVRPTLPAGYRLTVAQDLSRFVQESFDEARFELLRGGALAVLVIVFFLRSLRGSFIAAVTIPTTVISTITFMALMDFTLNMMSMLALTISVGMVIDDTIVVLENTYRHMEEGLPRMRAAYVAISEIGFAVIATSLAIGAVFIPVAFMDGIVGRFFFEFGLTVTFAVAVSTFIAVTLSPMLCSRLLTVTKQHGVVFRVLERGLVALETAYRRLLQFSLRFRWLVVGAAIAAFVGGMAITPYLGSEFVPAQDEDQFNIQVETPIGTSITTTDGALQEIERRLRTFPQVSSTFTTVGAGMEGRVNVATILTSLTPKSQRELSQQQIQEQVRLALADLKNLKLSVEEVPRVSGGGFRSAPVQYNVRGPDLGQLVEISDRMEAGMEANPDLVDVNSTYDEGKPEAKIVIQRDKAALLGVSVEDLGKAIRALIGGQEISTFEEDGETYEVRVRLAKDQRARPEDVLNVPVRTRSGRTFTLANLVQVNEGTGPVQIDRQDRSRQVTVMANLKPGKPLGAALEDVRRIESEIGLPAGVTSAFTGAGDMMAESFANILFSMALAAVLIYMVLAAQFESLVHPFTVMLSLPLSVVGALGLLFATGRTLNIFSMIGMIMLMGLVTKNAILLVDYTNLLRRTGISRRDALLQAGPVRLRPILMTACSTVAGMIPVAIGLGAGAETRAPMATAIVGGLLTSTLLTLVVVPVVYSLLDDVGLWIRRGVFGREEDSAALGTDPAASLAAATGDAPQQDLQTVS
jgi:HAE1 family hydrophobic/amphiphilic exporter-1